MTWSPQHRKELKENGFTIAPLLTPAMARETKAIMKQELLELQTQSELTSVLRKECPALERVLPAVLNPARILAQSFSRVQDTPVNVLAFIKSPSNAHPTHAHQDISYEWNRPPKERASLTTWVALDECSEASGALSFLPGSHLLPVSPPEDHLRADFQDRQETDAWIRNAVTPSVQVGEAITFDCRTWHASPLFTGKGSRFGLVFRWHSDEVIRSIPVEKPPTSPREFGMNTSGELLIEAISGYLQSRAKAPIKGSLRDVVRGILVEIQEKHLELPPNVITAVSRLEASHNLYTNAGIKADDQFIWGPIRDEVIPYLTQQSAQTNNNEEARDDE